MSVFHVGMLGLDGWALISASSSWLQLPDKCRPWEAVELMLLTGFLPSIWENYVVILAPGCGTGPVLGVGGTGRREQAYDSSSLPSK